MATVSKGFLNPLKAGQILRANIPIISKLASILFPKKYADYEIKNIRCPKVYLAIFWFGNFLAVCFGIVQGFKCKCDWVTSISGGECCKSPDPWWAPPLFILYVQAFLNLTTGLDFMINELVIFWDNFDVVEYLCLDIRLGTKPLENSVKLLVMICCNGLFYSLKLYNNLLTEDFERTKEGITWTFEFTHLLFTWISYVGDIYRYIYIPIFYLKLILLMVLIYNCTCIYKHPPIKIPVSKEKSLIERSRLANLDAWREIFKFIEPLNEKDFFDYSVQLCLSRVEALYVFSKRKVDMFGSTNLLINKATSLRIRSHDFTDSNLVQKFLSQIPSTLNHIDIPPISSQDFLLKLLLVLKSKCTNLFSIKIPTDVFFKKIDNHTYQDLFIEDISLGGICYDTNNWIINDCCGKLDIDIAHSADFSTHFPNLQSLKLTLSCENPLGKYHIKIPSTVQNLHINTISFIGNPEVCFEFGGIDLEVLNLSLDHNLKINFEGYTLKQMSKLKTVRYSCIKITEDNLEYFILPPSVETLKLNLFSAVTGFFSNLKYVRFLELCESESYDWIKQLTLLEYVRMFSALKK
jgi:hypothetical protein